jgi:DNA-binding MarR family transcriptional regulator
MSHIDPAARRDLAHELTRHGRLLYLVKANLAAQRPGGLDSAAFSLLLTLIRSGPLRQGELADKSLLDPSTVSRYVKELVRAGFVARRPDPLDGRAVQLIPTEQGAVVGAEMRERKERLVESLLGGWPPEEVATFIRLLRRLNDGMEEIRDHPPA